MDHGKASSLLKSASNYIFSADTSGILPYRILAPNTGTNITEAIYPVRRVHQLLSQLCSAFAEVRQPASRSVDA